MPNLKCISHTELAATTWTEIVDGTRIENQLIETIYVCNINTGLADRTYRLALILSGESTTPMSKNYLYIDNTLSNGQTSVKEVDIGMRPGDKLYAYASDTGIVVSVFGTA